MKVTIRPKLLEGTVTPPPSKSISHRYLIGAALSGGESVLSGMGQSQDISATISCLRALGAEIWDDGDGLHVRGSGGEYREADELPVLDCGESGSTLRFLIPVALTLRGGAVFRGRGRLLERPLDPYVEAFRGQGVKIESLPGAVRITGRLKSGIYSLPGDVSSQFISGLLFTLPNLEGDSEIRLTTPLASASYVGLTEDTLRAFSISFKTDSVVWRIPGGQTWRPLRAAVEADYSQAAFFLAVNEMGSRIAVAGLNPESRQGDRAIVEMLEKLRSPGDVELNVEDCPDLVPPIAARAALRAGAVTHITGAGRLRIKESDRLAAMAEILNALGGSVREEPDGLIIEGKETLAGGAAVSSWNDHRIAMAAAIAATRCRAPVTVLGAESVRKSYPLFWKNYVSLGGEVHCEEEEL